MHFQETTVTCWEILGSLQDTEDETERAALTNRVLETYWPPLLEFAKRDFQGRTDHEDIVQAFFLLCWTKGTLGKARKEKGRFRNFLVRCFRRFALNWIRAEKAQRRQPDGGVGSLDEIFEESGDFLVDGDGDEESGAVQEVCLRHVASLALAELKKKCEKQDRLRRYRVFEARYVAPLAAGAKEPTLAELAKKFEYPSEASCKAVLESAYKDFRDIVRSRLTLDTSDNTAIEADWERLWAGKLLA